MCKMELLTLVEPSPIAMGSAKFFLSIKGAIPEKQCSYLNIQMSHQLTFDIVRKLSKAFDMNVIKRQCVAITSANTNMGMLAKESTSLLSVLEKLYKNALCGVSTVSIMCE